MKLAIVSNALMKVLVKHLIFKAAFSSIELVYRPISTFLNSAVNNRLQHEALGNKPHKHCSLTFGASF